LKKINLAISYSLILFLTISPILSSHSLNIDKGEQNLVLVMGFGPFLNYKVNPSELIAEELDNETINGAKIIGFTVLPNLYNFTESIEIVYEAIEFYNPDYVFSIGLVAPHEEIRIEKIGFNLKREKGKNSKIEILIPKERLLRFSPLPVIKIVRELRRENITSKVSIFGGLSLCNGMLYSVLHYICENNLHIKSGFIHVPLHKTEENPDGMELETLVNATRITIKTCIDHFDRHNF